MQKVITQAGLWPEHRSSMFLLSWKEYQNLLALQQPGSLVLLYLSHSTSRGTVPSAVVATGWYCAEGAGPPSLPFDVIALGVKTEESQINPETRAKPPR